EVPRRPGRRGRRTVPPEDRAALRRGRAGDRSGPAPLVPPHRDSDSRVSSPTVTGRRPLIAVAAAPALLDPTHALRDAFTATGATVTTVDLVRDPVLPPGTTAIVL